MSQEFIRSLFTGKNTNIFLGIAVVVASVFSYLASDNNLELTNRLEIFEGRVGAVESFIDKEGATSHANEDSILVIETKLEVIQEDIQEIKSDLKFLVNNR